MKPLVGRWVWLFPLTYCLHIAEEYWGGESFYRWASRLLAMEFTAREFLALNGAAMAVMCLCLALACSWRSMQWLVVTFGFVVAFNGFAHAVASVATHSYSPGLVSGILVWDPLGAYAMRRAHKSLPRRQFLVGLAVGVVAHAAVTLIAITR